MTPSTQFAVEYQEEGSGATICFVPGSFSTGSSWRGIAAPLSARFRTVSTSLSGYGKTAERRLSGGDHMEDELDILDAVLRRIDAPTHLVAHSFGAWVALLFAARRPSQLLSLTLLEPTGFQLLALCDEAALNEHVNQLVHRYVNDWQNGDAFAVRQIIDFYGGEGAFTAFPEPMKQRLASQTATNILDWLSGYASPTSLAELGSIRMPIVIACGSNSHPAMKRCTQLLTHHLSNAEFKMIEGANHFMMGTHAKEVTDIVEAHIGR
jgi:pimeloyl-ACP methyl ester carboxylesterase